MNLTKLFSTQKVLRDRIGYNEPDRFNKLVLALLVEVGECANEHRCFKFWSKNQEPRVKGQRQGRTKDGSPARHIEAYNPLLEEYVDGLHFVLELGIECGYTPDEWKRVYTAKDVTIQFVSVYQTITNFSIHRTKESYYSMLEVYVGLGLMLGFTWEQIEQAYFAKNEINHERQNNGY